MTKVKTAPTAEKPLIIKILDSFTKQVSVLSSNYVTHSSPFPTNHNVFFIFKTTLKPCFSISSPSTLLATTTPTPTSLGPRPTRNFQMTPSIYCIKAGSKSRDKLSPLAGFVYRHALVAFRLPPSDCSDRDLLQKDFLLSCITK